MIDLDGKLEPETKPMGQDAALYSIAISLKRIADRMDAMAGVAEGMTLGQLAFMLGTDFASGIAQVRSRG